MSSHRPEEVAPGRVDADRGRGASRAVRTVSAVIGGALVLASVASLASLLDVDGDGTPAGPIRTVLPLAFAAGASGAFAVGGRPLLALISGPGLAALSAAVFVGATIVLGP